jgi:uncharacterized protein YndB with AHSA1/START domain
VDIRKQIDIAASPETVFSLISDVEKLRMWADSISESAFITPYDPADPVGARFRQTASQFGKEVSYEGEITSCEPPTKFSVELGSEKFRMRISYRLKELKRTTRLVYSAKLIEANMKYQLMFAAFASLAEDKLVEQLEKLKDIAEKAG